MSYVFGGRLFAAASLSLVLVANALAQSATPGVTATEIKIGNTTMYSGPASAYGIIGRAAAAYFKMINDQGGIGGKTIIFDTLDDAYNPSKTVEQTRKLVEQDEVAYIVGPTGTMTNSATVKYLNSKGVPQLLVNSNAAKFSDYKLYPWTTAFSPSDTAQARIYAHYIIENAKDPKIGILYQNDDFGKAYPAGVKDVLGDKYDKLVVKSVSYEVSDPTIESQLLQLKESGANVLLTAATPKFAAQEIRKLGELGWKPLHVVANVSISVGSVLVPAGKENAVGLISAGFMKDPTDPSWDNDPGMNEWRSFMKKYMPGEDMTDAGSLNGYAYAFVMAQILRQAVPDFSRENVMRQATNLKDLTVPVLLPGVTVNTSPTKHNAITEMQLQRFNGQTWERFGNVVSE